jgi:hypothetical protein
MEQIIVMWSQAQKTPHNLTHVEHRKVDLIEIEGSMWTATENGREGWEEVGQRVLIHSYEQEVLVGYCMVRWLQMTMSRVFQQARGKDFQHFYHEEVKCLNRYV